MLKIGLLGISLSLFTACNNLPPFPEVTQYGVRADVSRPGFYGVNNKSGKRVYKTFDNPDMKGAQCLSSEDYKASEEWIKVVKEIAQQRCR